MPIYRNFYDDFETYSVGDLPSTHYDVSGARGAPQIVTSAIDAGLGPLSGTKMAQVNWENTSLPQQTNMTFTFNSNWGGSDEIFVRFKYRCDSDMPTTPGGIHCFRWIQGSTNSINFAHSIGVNDMTLLTWIDSTFVGGIVNTGTNVLRDTSKWKTYEQYLKFSATTHATTWIDGSIVVDGGDTTDNSGFSFPTKFSTFDFTSNWSGGSGSPPDNNNHLYIDDFEVFSNAQWSLGWDEATTGLMSDATVAAVAGGGVTTGNMSLR